MAKRKPHAPLIEPGPVQDAFASGFVAQDWEDWVRVIGWADDVTGPGADDGGGARDAVRRKSVSLVIPRSSVRALIDVLQASEGKEPKRHS